MHEVDKALKAFKRLNEGEKVPLTPYTQRTWYRRVVVPWAYEFGRKLKYVCAACWLEIVMIPLIFLFFYLTGCSKIVEPDEIVTPDDLSEIAEAYCAAHPELTCGHVYMCAQEADNALGHVEICKLDEHPLEWVEAIYGTCEPTPRHQGLCWWCCGEGCGAGGNAYNGTFCPAPPEEIGVDAGVSPDVLFDPSPTPPTK